MWLVSARRLLTARRISWMHEKKSCAHAYFISHVGCSSNTIFRNECGCVSWPEISRYANACKPLILDAHLQDGLRKKHRTARTHFLAVLESCEFALPWQQRTVRCLGAGISCPATTRNNTVVIVCSGFFCFWTCACWATIRTCCIRTEICIQAGRHTLTHTHTHTHTHNHVRTREHTQTHKHARTR